MYKLNKEKSTGKISLLIHVTLCAIWYHLYKLKNVKNTHEGMILLGVITKNITSPWMFSTFLKLYKWYQIAQSITLKVFQNSA